MLSYEEWLANHPALKGESPPQTSSSSNRGSAPAGAQAADPKAATPTATQKPVYNPLDDIMRIYEPKTPTVQTKQNITSNALFDTWRGSVGKLENDRKEREAKAKAEAEQKEYKQLQSQLERIDANRAYVTTTEQNDALEKERASVVKRMSEIGSAPATTGEKIKNAFQGSGSRTTEGFTREQETQYQELLSRLDGINSSAVFAFTTEQSDALEKERRETLNALHQMDADAGREARAYDARDRADAFFGGWGKGTAASYTNAAASGADVLATTADKLADASSEKDRRVMDNPYAGWATDELSAANFAAAPVTEETSGLARKRRADIDAAYETADKLLTESEQQMAKAKYGTSAVGSFALDAAKTGMDILADTAASAVGVPGLANMAARVYGGESQQARLAGDDVYTAAAKGLKSALIEVATEKVAGPFEKAYGKTALSSSINKAVDKLNASGLLKWAADAAGEGFEEGMSDVLNTVADHIFGWDSGENSVLGDIAADKDEIVYDMLLGAFVGAFGGAGNFARERANTQTAPVQTETARPAASAEAKAEVSSVLERGRVNSGTADEIISSPALADAFYEVTGIALDGSTAAKREAVRRAAREYAYTQQQSEAAEANFATQQQQTQSAADAALAEYSQQEAARQAEVDAGYQRGQREAAAKQRADTISTPYDSYIRGVIQGGGSYAEAGEIARTPELRAAWERMTGTKLPDTVNKARDVIANTRGDVYTPQMNYEQFLLDEQTAAQRAALTSASDASQPVGGISALPTTQNVKQGDSGVLNSPLNLNSRDAAAEVRKNTAPTQETSNEDQSVISKMRGAKPQLEQMQSVSSVTGNEIGQNGRIVDRLMNFVDRIGGKVARPGFGDVQITRSKIKSSMIGHGVGNAKIETFAAVPDVIANGQEIDHQANWKGRNYDTYVFAAPVDYRGQKTYVGVVVQKDSASNRYYLHEVLGEDGEVIFKNDTAPAPTPDGTSALSGDLETVVSARAVNREQANPTSLAPVGDTGAFSPPIADTQQGVSAEDVSSDTSIPTSGQNVNGNFAGNAERERGVSKNVRTDTAMEQELRDSFEQSPEMYTQLSNKDTLAKAKEIYAKGYEYARSEVERAIGKGKEGYKIAPEIVPLAKMVSNELTRRGEVETARGIMADIALEATAAGQFNQAQRIMRNSDPVTALMSIEKLVEEVNTEFQKNNPKSKWKAELTETEKQKILATDFTEDGAYKQIYDEIATRLGKEMPSSAFEKITEIRRINMLLRPRTQIKNIVSNAPMVGLRKGAETLSIGIQSALTKTGLMEEADRTRAWASKEQRQMARDYYDANKDDINGQSNKWDLRSVLREKRTIFKGGAIEKAVSKMTGKEIDSFGEALRQVTYNCLEKGDAPFVKSAFVDSLAQYCAAKGITSSENITREAIDFATANAMEATFKNANVIAQSLNTIKRNSSPAVSAAIDILIPFTTTPANILSLMGDYSPVGFGKMFAKGGPAEKIDAFSKASVGTAMLALGFALRNAGWITGGEDDDKDKAALDKATGQGTYSIGGKVSYDWAQPVGSLLAFGAEIADAVRGQESWDSALMNAIYTAGDATLNLSVFQNIISVLRGSGKPTQQIIDAIMEGGATQLVPGVAGDIAKIIDGTVRSTYTGGNVFDDIGAKTLSTTPVLSKKLPESVNVKGETNTRGELVERAVNTLLNPTNITRGKRNAVDEEIYRLYDTTGSTVFFPSVSPYKIEYDNQTYTMNGKDRETFQKTQGQTYYELAQPLLGSEMYKALNDNQKAAVLKSIRDYALDAAKRQFVDGRGDEYSNTQWDPVAELSKKQISTYIPAKQALKDGANSKGGKKTYDAIDLLLDGYKKLPDAVQDRLMEENLNIANLLYADSKGIGSKAWYDTHNAVKESEKEIGRTSDWVAAEAIDKLGGSDEEKLLKLSSEVTPSYYDYNRGGYSRPGIVKRYDAAINSGMSWDTWTKVEKLVGQLRNGNSSGWSCSKTFIKKALADNGYTTQQINNIWAIKNTSTNSENINYVDEYWGQLIENAGRAENESESDDVMYKTLLDMVGLSTGKK